jgi:hypothetical protein
MQKQPPRLLELAHEYERRAGREMASTSDAAKSKECNDRESSESPPEDRVISWRLARASTTLQLSGARMPVLVIFGSVSHPPSFHGFLTHLFAIQFHNELPSYRADKAALIFVAFDRRTSKRAGREIDHL